MTEESGLALWSNQSLSSGAVFPTLLLWQQNAAAGAPRPAPSPDTKTALPLHLNTAAGLGTEEANTERPCGAPGDCW